MTVQTQHKSQSHAAHSVTDRALPAVAALLVGLFLVFGTGFAHPMAIHNAAHDVRHAFAFPCH